MVRMNAVRRTIHRPAFRGESRSPQGIVESKVAAGSWRPLEMAQRIGTANETDRTSKKSAVRERKEPFNDRES